MNRVGMERRRLSAARDLGRGMRKAAVARKYRISYVTVWRWESTVHARGMAGLRRRKATGRPPKLSSDDMRRLRGILCRGASYQGGGAGILSSTTVVSLIRNVFRVRYHPHHVPRLLKKMELPGRWRPDRVRPILRD